MKKQPEITDATRNTFLEAFCDIYQTKPIEKITVKEIVARAGYSRATFYNYFQDAYELLECVENEFIDSIMETITANIGKQRSMESFVHDFVEITKSKNTYIQVFMNSSNSSTFVGKLKERALPHLVAVFGITPENQTARYALEFYISGLISMLGSWMRKGQDLETEELACLVKGILQEGILHQLQ